MCLCLRVRCADARRYGVFDLKEVQQFGDGRDLVALLIALDLTEDQLHSTGKGGDHVTGFLCGAVTVTNRCAVDGDGHALALDQLAQVKVQFAHPGVEAFGQHARIETVQNFAEGIVRRRAVTEVAERFQIFPLMIGEHGHLREGGFFETNLHF